MKSEMSRRVAPAKDMCAWRQRRLRYYKACSPREIRSYNSVDDLVIVLHNISLGEKNTSICSDQITFQRAAQNDPERIIDLKVGHVAISGL